MSNPPWFGPTENGLMAITSQSPPRLAQLTGARTVGHLAYHFAGTPMYPNPLPKRHADPYRLVDRETDFAAWTNKVERPFVKTRLHASWTNRRSRGNKLQYSPLMRHARRRTVL
jgi:hypothetical protein